MNLLAIISREWQSVLDEMILGMMKQYLACIIIKSFIKTHKEFDAESCNYSFKTSNYGIPYGDVSKSEDEV